MDEIKLYHEIEALIFKLHQGQMSETKMRQIVRLEGCLEILSQDLIKKQD